MHLTTLPQVCAALLLGAIATAQGHAKIAVSPVFGTNMVLQRDQPVAVRGTADPGESVTLRFAGQERRGAADAHGKWVLTLDPMPASSEPRVMAIVGSTAALELRNILVGDVWLCVGQSNMAFQLNKARGGPEAAAAADLPEIRILGIHFNATPEPRDEVRGEWTECSPKRAAKSSAVAFYFARDLHRRLGVPIGLVGSSLSGSYPEIWFSREAQLADPYTRPYVEAWDWWVKRVHVRELANAEKKRRVVYVDEAGSPVDLKEWNARFVAWKRACADARRRGQLLPADFPAGFEPLAKLPRPDDAVIRPAGGFNGCIAPLTVLPIKGVVWYQGESHIVAPEYGRVLERLILDWRERFGVADLPFLIVGLPNWKGRQPVASQPVGGAWPWVREQQFAVANRLPGVFVTVNTDTATPDKGDLHPTNKEPVGVRLALLAASRVYGQTVEATGPVFERMSVEGNRVRLRFCNVGAGLQTVAADVPAEKGRLPVSPVLGFAMTGADRQWAWANAVIEGNDIMLSAEGIEEPVAVRYNWADYPVGNLFGKSGLPVAPFRTDSWPP